MNLFLVAAIFLSSCVVLSWLSSRLVKDLVQIAKYLRWREFIIAFFVMSFATSLPNLFIDFNATLQGKPELAFGDIIGGNLVDLTLVLAIAIFFSRKGISIKSDMVQMSAIFTTAIAIAPLLLVLDGQMGRMDGILLISIFIAYTFWIFSKKERFEKVYEGNFKNPIQDFKGFAKNVFRIILLLALLLIASQAVVASAQFFSNELGISLALVGILLVGLGNAFPEIYFSIISVRQGQNYLVLGDLMGSVIVCATLVLGLIALFLPFEIKEFSPFLVARIFLIIAAVLSLYFIKTGRKLTKKEGLMLLSIYIFFLISEVFI